MIDQLIAKISEISNKFYLIDSHGFIDAARLLLSDLKEAESGPWVDEQHLNKLDLEDQLLVKTTEIAYLNGKGNQHLVPVLTPDDTVHALIKVADQKIRSDAGVTASNNVLFASTQD